MFDIYLLPRTLTESMPKPKTELKLSKNMFSAKDQLCVPN